MQRDGHDTLDGEAFRLKTPQKRSSQGPLQRDAVIVQIILTIDIILLIYIDLKSILESTASPNKCLGVTQG